MASNVPSIESFIESFPNRLPKIQGLPTYDSLVETRRLLKENAATIPSLRGGGNNGYLGIVVSDAVYATIHATPFDLPDNPGPTPVIPGGASAAVVGELVRQHTENLREWREFTNVRQALKKQLMDAIEPIYLRALKNQHVGFNNVTLLQMLTHLFTNYGRLEPQDLVHNANKLNTPWDPNTPFELLIEQIDECIDFADAGNQAFPANQIVNTAYTLVFNTGMFFDDCKDWLRKAVADRTWDNFKTFFLQAQSEHRQQQRTAAKSGYSANAALTGAKENIQEETAQALANLATATASDRTAFANLVNNNSLLTSQLTDALGKIKALEQKLANTGNTLPLKQIDNRHRHNSYCWTHGYRVSKNHNSQNCERTAANHKKEATHQDNMGGSQAGKE
jgi:hypothetical protein